MRRILGSKFLTAILATAMAVLTGVGPGPAPALAQTASDILQRAMERYRDRMEGIENYTVIQSMGGMEGTAYFQRVETGGGRPVYRQMTSMDLSQSGSQKSANPFLKEGGAEMAIGVADPSSPFHEIAPRARLEGSERVAGQDAWVIAISDLSDIDLGATTGVDAAASDSDGGFQPTSMKLWIDNEQYVTLRTAITGTMEMQGQSSEVTLDARMEDYREVAGMLHPFHTEMSIVGMTGVLTSEQQAQLSQAQQQLQKQLENMDEAQRAMVERMMKDQMPDMEALAGSGPMSFTVDVQEVRVNEGPPEAMETQARTLQNMAGTAQGQNQMQEELSAGIPPSQLTPEYMEGEWCTRGFEPAIFRFYADGSHHMALAEQRRVDTSARPVPYQRFLERFEDSPIIEKTEDSFMVLWRGEREVRWLRNCEGRTDWR